MKTKAKTSAKTSFRRKGRNDFARNKERSTQSPKGSSDIYQKFTDLIIEKLEQEVILWKQPWYKMGMPSNYLTKKRYKGSKALQICYWNFAFRDKKTEKVIPEDRIGEYDLKLVSKSGLLKEYKVFPMEQIERIDWEFPEINKAEPLSDNEQCRKIYEEMLRAPELVHSGSSAYYRADLDQITMPDKKLFAYKFYSRKEFIA